VTWAFVALAALLAFITTFSYLGGFVDPVGNMHNMPLAIVNEDAGAAIGGGQRNFGDEVLKAVLAPNPQLGDRVKWTVLPGRGEALSEISRNRYYAAIVVPTDFSASVVSLANPKADSRLAQIEILANPAAGSIAGVESQSIATAAVAMVSKTTSEQLTSLLNASGATIAPGAAPALADPVRAQITIAQPIGPKTARGLAPFYFAVMMTLAGFIGANVVSVGVDFVSGTIHLDAFATRLRQAPLNLSRLSVWRAKLLLTLVMSLLAGVLETWMAVGILGMDAPNAFTLGLFAVLGVAAIATVTLFFITAFGTAGLVLGVLFTTIFGVPSAGGVYPLEMVPPFFQFLATWLPLRYMTDGTRALLFFDGRGDAGLTTAIWVLLAYLLGAIAAGAATALAIDRVIVGRPSRPPTNLRSTNEGPS
jgi:YhgE/Pip-like protein